ncbi:MAG TPA: response regulator [Candidatus Acidoferrales bacterium]|nr:response regulator [Candidatus Acidoferrales bacterium]
MKTRAEILLVEDNANDLELMRRSFRHHRLASALVVARDGVEALDYIFGSADKAGTSHTPKVILLDLKLPRLDGVEVLRRLKADERTQKIPVIALIASEKDSERLKRDQLPVSGYLVKPVDFQNFARAVSKAGLDWMIAEANS